MARFYGCSSTAFEELCLRYRPRLFAYYRSRGVTPEDADDLIQDVYIKVVNTKRTPAEYDPAGEAAAAQRLGLAADRARTNGARPFDTQRTFYPWLFRIAHHELVSFTRKRSHFAPPPARDPEGDDPARWFEDLSDPDASLDRDVLAFEFVQAFRDCYARIARTVEGQALWHWCAGATLEELSLCILKSIATTSRAIKKAAEACRRCLKEKGYEAVPDLGNFLARLNSTERRKRVDRVQTGP